MQVAAGRCGRTGGRPAPRCAHSPPSPSHRPSPAPGSDGDRRDSPWRRVPLSNSHCQSNLGGEGALRAQRGAAEWLGRFWPLDQAYTLSSDPECVDPGELRRLWLDAFGDSLPPPKHSEARIRTMLRHAFTVQALFVEEEASQRGGGEEAGQSNSPCRRLIGFARTESDGVFSALISDLCIHPDYQRRGLGRRLLSALGRTTRARGVSNFVAFPTPNQRVFFWKSDFTWNRKFVIMGLQAEEARALGAEAPGQSGEVGDGAR